MVAGRWLAGLVTAAALANGPTPAVPIPGWGTGGPPAATVCWIWDANLPVGTPIPSAYTRRVRQIVVSQGPDGLGRWQSFERDLEADFLRAFGDESRTVPPMVALAIGADSDNSGGRSLAWLSPLRWADH